MRAIIHAGMHKTGSSSIQQTFGRKKLRNFHYPPLSAYNHSIFLGLLFDENPHAFPPFANQGLSQAEIEVQQAEHWVKFEQAIDAAREKGGLVLSGEHISTMPPVAKQRMHDHLAKRFSRIDVMAYIRPPVSYMQSGFQQNLKGTRIRKLEPQRLWPSYRQRFEPLDEIFGRDNVKLKLFDKAHLVAGDVVRDFAAEIGEDIAETDFRRVNESLSLEAIGLLFVQRKYGDGFVNGFRGAPRANAAFIRALGGIGSGKLVFAPELIAPVLEKNRADIEWMEARLGTTLAEMSSAKGRLIGGEEDLVALALENEEALDRLLLDKLGKSTIHRLLTDIQRRLAGRKTKSGFRSQWQVAESHTGPAEERLAIKLDILRRLQF